MGLHPAVVLGLDPGRDKMGFAVAGMGGELFFSGIVPVAERERFWAVLERGVLRAGDFVPWLREGGSGEKRVLLSVVAVGDGTCGPFLIEEVRGRLPGLRVFSVDERGTTLEARGLYWRLHRPPWWQRLLPSGLRTPPRGLDDLAAWAIAMRAIDRMPSA